MVSASRLYLPKIDDPPATILDHLLQRFPQVGRDTWRARVSQGLVTLSDGTTLHEDSAYRHGLTVYYRKHVPFEPQPVEEPSVIFRDDEIIVVDKPHGMTVTPAGDHVERSLLTILQRNTELPDLAPVHRLDRDTAGLILFAIKPAARGPYHRLFSEGTIEREYLAVAHVVDSLNGSHWRIENRIEPGEPWFRRRIVSGAINAITEIDLIDVHAGLGRFRLFPKTGKKHQLRVHMASIGCPIVGDPFYPTLRKKQDGDPPLQLLATRLTFCDPLTRVMRTFTSLLRLHAS